MPRITIVALCAALLCGVIAVQRARASDDQNATASSPRTSAAHARTTLASDAQSRRVTAEAALQAAHAVRISAERFQFTPSEVKVRLGTAIEFRLKSDDTAHGFRIIGQSVDITIPKRGRGEATVMFTPPQAGTYVFECSRMCGAGHSFMRGVIRVTAAEGTP